MEDSTTSSRSAPLMDSNQHRKKRQRLYTKYGHLIGAKTEDIPEKHRAKVGGLRCFHVKTVDGVRKRCGKPATTGSLYCKKPHNGANTRALVTGKYSSKQLTQYRGSFDNRMSMVFEAFLNDSDIVDHKRELATLRMVLSNYLKTVTTTVDEKTAEEKMEWVRSIMDQGNRLPEKRWEVIVEYVSREKSMDDPDVIDRINKLVDNIGKSIERVMKIENASNYMMTPEGYRILLRSILEVIGNVIKEPDVIRKVKEGFMDISVNTGGDLSKSGTDPIDV